MQHQSDPAFRRLVAAAAATLAVLLVLPWFSGQSPAFAAEADTAEDRLRAVEDHIAIENLLMRYAAALNTDDADTYVSLFTPDAVFELKRDVDQQPFLGPFVGRDALREQWFGDVDDDAETGRRFGPMRHVTTNYEITVDGDTASVRAFFMEVVSNGDNSPPGSRPPTIHAMGRYEDELVRQNGQWLFSKRTVITDMNTQWEP
jgi:ketosteroid isomerase-like protein